MAPLREQEIPSARLALGHGAASAGTATATARHQAFDARARPMMALDCRFENRARKAFKYPDLLAWEFDGGSTITLYFEMATVVIEGRNLVAGYDHLVECKVASVQEKHCSEFEADPAEAYVDRIRVGPPQLQALAESTGIQQAWK
jgi:hypothetical protein